MCEDLQMPAFVICENKTEGYDLMFGKQKNKPNVFAV